MQLEVVCLVPAGGLGDASDQDRGNRHDDATKRSQVRDDLSCGRGLAG